MITLENVSITLLLLYLFGHAAAISFIMLHADYKTFNSASQQLIHFLTQEPFQRILCRSD